MASKKQVEAKALKLGAIFSVDYNGAHLGAPAGMIFEGYHATYIPFYLDGKQSVWDDFYGYLKNLEPCTYDRCECATQKAGA
jgi:hypothetical protein